MNYMKRYSIALLLLNVFWSAYSQSNNQNYISTRTYTKEDGSTYIDAIQYFDGLGRPVQTVQAGITPLGKDLISIQEYDAFGRASKSWLPIPKASNNGSYYTGNLVNDSKSTYANDANAYSEPVYEPSPLNRITKQFGPGQDWRSGNGHPVSSSYLTNSTTDNQLKCAYFYVSGNDLKKGNDYAAGQLYVRETKDEDGNTSYEFTDKLGQVILTRQIAGSNSNHDTYCVYDDFGLKRFVLPPMAVDSLSGISWTESDPVLKKFAYLYRYDNRNRCTEKRIPGTEWQYMVYDQADRLIFSQDGEQQQKGKWLFTVYDVLSRPVITGLCNNTQTAVNAHQSVVTSAEFKFVSTNASNTYFSGTGYQLNNLNLSNPEILSVTYYDNYMFLDIPSISAHKSHLNYQTQTNFGEQHPCAQGLLTGTRTKILDANNDATWTVLYYDSRGRVIQKKSTIYMNGYMNTYTAYSFTGLKERELTQYEGDFTVCNGEVAGMVEDYVYEYDHAGRLKKTTLNGIDIVTNTYNELGQLKRKQQGDGAFIVDYTYNIRGWLKTMNEINTVRFQQTLLYQDGGRYNGNISQMDYGYTGYPQTLRTKNCYFSYDALNRLTNAFYESKDEVYDMYYTYDKHGNPLSIYRYLLDLPENWTITHTGNQKTKIVRNGTINNISYNRNGSVVSDGSREIVSIRYNLLNLPDTIQFKNGNAIYYTYDASGMKLQTRHITVKPNLVSPITVAVGQVRPLTTSETFSVLTTQYIGNTVHENGALKMTLFPGGYIRRMMAENHKGDIACREMYHYYLQDYLGNNRDVMRSDGGAFWSHIQRTEYSPFGMAMGPPRGDAGAQPYKFGGKEEDKMHGFNTYDFIARFYNPELISFMTIDPMAEKYYNISPYAYCLNNPVRYIDPDGREWKDSRDENIDDFQKKLDQYDNACFDKRGYNYLAGDDDKSKPSTKTDPDGSGKKASVELTLPIPLPALAALGGLGEAIKDAFVGFGTAVSSAFAASVSLVVGMIFLTGDTRQEPYEQLDQTPTQTMESSKKKSSADSEYSTAGEHTKNKRPSAANKHQKGRKRVKQDQGGEKGDARRTKQK
jgi:RHS repeat-associated protein